MPGCELCNGRQIKAHSFERIGTLKDGITAIFYTSPRRIQIVEDTEEYVKGIYEHFKETAPNKWIWIFDSKDMMSGKSLSNKTVVKLAQHVQSEYASTLMRTFIVNPSTVMRVFLGVVRPFLKKATNDSIYMCSLGLVEVVHKLQEIGVQPTDIPKILALRQ